MEHRLLERIFSSKLQLKYPSMKVISLLVLDRMLPLSESPAIVLYGFRSHHEFPNVANSYWLESMSKFSRSGHVYVPYMIVDDNGQTIRHPPERYPETPLRELSVAIRLIEKWLMKSKPRARYFMRKKTTENLLLEMNKLSKTHGAEFIVAMIGTDLRTNFLPSACPS